jgi:hypothetical protein
MRLRSTRLTAIANAIRDKFYGAALNMRFDNTTSLDPRITFSRTTNATLTNSAGLIAYAPMNLLTFSEQFDNAAWETIGTVTKTANFVAAPNGTTTADRLQFAGASSANQIYQVFVSSPTAYTGSVWLRATSGSGRIKFGFFDGTIQTDYVNLTTEWTRVTSSKTLAASASSRACWIYPDTTGDLTDVCIWGAQLELGSTATTYNPTTVKNLLGFTENFDNAAWTKSNAFVQTNLLTYSQDFDNAAWTKRGTAAVTANAFAAPDGSTTADLVTGLGALGSNDLFQGNANVAVGLALAPSFYIQKVSSTGVLRLNNPASSSNGNWSIDLSLVESGWVRITSAHPSVTITTAFTGSGAANGGLQFAATTGGPLSFYIWGAQLVQGTSAGDYKATYAAAAAVGYTDIYGQPFAQKLVENTANSGHFLLPSAAVAVPAGASRTFSIYAKAGERSAITLKPNNAENNDVATFNLANGTIGYAAAGLTAAIASVGNGWYLCSVTDTYAGTSANLYYALATSPTASDLQTYTGDGTSGIYIFGAQLSDSASVDPYVYQPVAAPTSTAYYGPRFDYDPVTLAPKGLLIEEQRTNLVTYSEMFSDAAWSKQSSSVTANTAVAPNGAQTASTLTASSGTAFHYANRNAAVVISGANTFSFYVKKSNSTWIFFTLRDTSVNYFNLDTGAFGTTPDTCISQNVGNGWYRISVTRTDTTANCGIGIAGSNNNALFTATGTEAVFIWGAQLEAGAFATSYIPTVASQVTRAADSASMIGNNFARWYNVNEGTMFGDVVKLSPNIGFVLGLGYSGSAYAGTLYQPGNNTYIQPNVGAFGSSAIPAGGGIKVAVGIKAANYASCINGVVEINANPNAPFSGTNGALYLGSSPFATSSIATCYIKRFSYYNRRLADTELTAITS